jgi:hypothetical protein
MDSKDFASAAAVMGKAQMSLTCMVISGYFQLILTWFQDSARAQAR